MSTTEVLFHSNALHSLKHDQLVKLCKIHNIKHTGKKPELIERLQKHGSTLPKNRGGLPRVRDDPSSTSDEDGIQWESQTHRSEAWEVLESIEEVEERSSQGISNSMRGTTSTSGEFGTAGSKSGVGSSIRALATSLGIKKNGSSKSISAKTLPQSEENGQLEKNSVPYSSIPVNPVLPETDHFVLSELDEPLPGQATRVGLPAAPDARLSLSAVPGQVPSTPSKRGTTTTIRLVSNSAAVVNPGTQTPRLRPFATSFDLTVDTPTKPNSVTGDYAKIYPTLPSSSPPPPTPPPKSSATEEDMDIDMPGGFGVDLSLPVQAEKPFVFGSPRASAAAFTFNASAGATKMSVLEEMNQRLAQQGVESVPDSILDLPKASAGNSAKGREKQASVPDRFESQHRAEEAKMESIANWAKRHERLADKTSAPSTKKRKSSILVDVAGQHHKNQTSTREVDEENRRLSKRQRISIAENSVTPAPSIDQWQRDKEREAVKRMLERNKQKRRSSMGTRTPRASAGRAPPPKPKSRFGFLSSAKSLVQSVWSRSAKPAPPLQVTETKTPAKYPKHKVASTSNHTILPANPQPPKPTSARSRPPLPSFADEGLPSLLSSNQQSQDASTSSRTSLGIRTPAGGRRSSTLVPKAQRIPSSGKTEVQPHDGRVSSGSSRLYAPTASSLAKHQSIEGVIHQNKPKIQPRSYQATGAITRVPITSPPAGRIFRQPLQSPLPNSAIAIAVPGPPQSTVDVNTQGSSEVPSLGRMSRKPRISRSKVIAKLASKREANEMVTPRKSTGKVRSSLGAAATGTSHGGTRKSDAAINAAKKRVRQSEVNRHRKGASVDK